MGSEQPLMSNRSFDLFRKFLPTKKVRREGNNKERYRNFLSRIGHGKPSVPVPGKGWLPAAFFGLIQNGWSQSMDGGSDNHFF